METKTSLTQELKQAIEALKQAGEEYKKACKRRSDGGYEDDQQLYTQIVGKAWKNYLKYGGSPSMIN